MRWLIFFCLILGARAEEWDASNFPNPTAGQFQKCRMRTTANICDPDGVLTEQARYRLDHDLKQLEARTRQDNARTFCDKKGVTAAMAVARHVKGGSTDAVKRMANDMLQRWTLDPQCQKAIVIVVSTDDSKFWVARDDKVPVYAQEFTDIFLAQKSLFQQQNYQQALTNIMQATWQRALEKQGSPRTSSSDGGGFGGTGGFGQGGQQGFGKGGARGDDIGSGPAFKMPSIPTWFWLALIFIVIPLLCCCCLCYCCCCRGKKSDGGNAPGPMSDGGMGAGAPHRSGGGRFGNFLSSLSGAGIGSLAGRLLGGGLRGGGGGRGGGMYSDGTSGTAGYGMGGGGAYQGGGAYPAGPRPIYDDNQGQGGGGLYPSKAVKDEGGGGSWA